MYLISKQINFQLYVMYLCNYTLIYLFMYDIKPTASFQRGYTPLDKAQNIYRSIDLKLCQLCWHTLNTVVLCVLVVLYTTLV